jgi:hypothetical protein
MLHDGLRRCRRRRYRTHGQGVATDHAGALVGHAGGEARDRRHAGEGDDGEQERREHEHRPCVGACSWRGRRHGTRARQRGGERGDQRICAQVGGIDDPGRARIGNAEGEPGRARRSGAGRGGTGRSGTARIGHGGALSWGGASRRPKTFGRRTRPTRRDRLAPGPWSAVRARRRRRTALRRCTLRPSSAGIGPRATSRPGPGVRTGACPAPRILRPGWIRGTFHGRASPAPWTSPRTRAPGAVGGTLAA